MTKIILVGGCDYKAPDGGKAFCEALTDGFEEPVKILDCLFARPKEKWDEVYQKDKKFFAMQLPGKTIELELAQPEKFIQQMRWSNAIYIRGGSNDLLLDILHTCGDWLAELDGKTLAGSSAGACIIVKYYYELDSLKLGEGLGLLPMKIIVHWKSDYNAPNINWISARAKLKKYKEDLPLLALGEGKFVTIERP
mgnify:CR=1 FL=1